MSSRFGGYGKKEFTELFGFEVVKLFGNFDSLEFSKNSPEMLFIAVKK
jgi:hypothetical protein